MPESALRLRSIRMRRRKAECKGGQPSKPLCQPATWRTAGMLPLLKRLLPRAHLLLRCRALCQEALCADIGCCICSHSAHTANQQSCQPACTEGNCKGSAGSQGCQAWLAE